MATYVGNTADPPPDYVAQMVERYAPGFWRVFNDALAQVWSEVPGIVIHSWWRDPQHNAAVGGARLSQHMLGTAIDLGAQNLDRLKAAMERAQFTQLTIYSWHVNPHVHGQAWPGGPLPQKVLHALGWA